MESSPTLLDPSAVAQGLGRNLPLFRGMLRGLSDEDLRWKSTPGKWSLLECLHHMLDEERHDFCARAQLLLADDPWPSIDPEGWVESRSYNAQDPTTILQEFEAQRMVSIEWLKSLESIDLNVAREHAQLGVLHVGDFLCSWLAHDFQHLSQMARQRVQLIQAKALPYGISYTGA